MKRLLFVFTLGLMAMPSMAQANEKLWLSCQRMSGPSAVEQCYSSLNSKYFAEGVIDACDRWVDQDKLMCLQAASDQSFKPKDVVKCAKKKKAKDAIKCFKNKGKDDLPGDEEQVSSDVGGTTATAPKANTYVGDLPESDGVCRVRRLNQSVDLSRFYALAQQTANYNRRCVIPQILGRARSAMIFDSNGSGVASDRGLLTGAEATAFAAAYNVQCEPLICELEQ